MRVYSDKAPIGGYVDFGTGTTRRQSMIAAAQKLQQDAEDKGLGPVPGDRILCIHWGGIMIAVDLIHVLMAATGERKEA